MFIKQITIEGVEADIEIMRTDDAALVTEGNRIICEVLRDEDREQRYWKAHEVAKTVCGPSRNGEPNATNSMIHDVLREIERVAGC